MPQDVEVRDLEPQTAVVEHAVTDRQGMPGVVDASYKRLFAGLAGSGAEPAGPPFIRYLETGERFSMQLGVPVSPAAWTDGLERAVLPGGPAAVLRHVGPYEELPQAVQALFAWLSEHGEQAAGPFWESYVTDPSEEPEPARRITEIVAPLKPREPAA
jgi:AraC family transcriptional regulator